MSYVYLMEKQDRETGVWTLCTGPWLFAGYTKAEADEQARDFTEDSVGVRFRAKRYKRG